MQKTWRFLIIDDDQATIEVYRALLESAGHAVDFLTSSDNFLEKINKLRPDCVLCDLMLPGKDGFELFQILRADPQLKQPVFIMITARHYESDRQRALALGVDGYLLKPIKPEMFLDTLVDIIEGVMTVQFWGVRGTLPVPGEKTLYYGGNTNCVTLNIGGKQFFIFDAGSGIKELSNDLVSRNVYPLKAKIFISHPHYDHINGLPFFVPLFLKGNSFEILGLNQGDRTIEELISGTMDGVYLPFTIGEFGASLQFRDLGEEDFFIGEIYVKTLLLNHPGRCLGYRIQYKEKIFCYLTDNELYLESALHYNQFEVDRLINFVKAADLLVIDTTYKDAEYLAKVGWGHSSVTRVVDLADLAKVKTLCLYHHDPEQYDKDIDQKLKQAKRLLKTKQSKTLCIAAREGEKMIL